MTNTISNTDNVIDSRDIIARIEELQDELDTLIEAVTEACEAREANPCDETTAAHNAAMEEEAEWRDSEEAEELKTLQAFAEEASGYASDWQYGESLINDDYFTQYAQELAEDTGSVNKDAAWPNNHIDWEAAAEELKQDYSAVEFDGTTYWTR